MSVDDLTPAQQRAVTTPAHTVCVLAAAGAGKTRVLTRRVAYRIASGEARPEHVLAITFTRKAAGELRQRLGSLGFDKPVSAGTFHSVALSQLRRWWADRRTPEPNLLERKGRLLAELVAERPALAGTDLSELAGHIEWAKARLVTPASFAAAAGAARRPATADPEAVAALYARYEDEKKRRRVVDFDDLLARYAAALAEDSRFAQAQQWRWQHVFVDELQDVNPLQGQLLTNLLGDNEDVFVVGDPNQAIYGWNGADPGFLLDFARRWPACEVVRLDDNHRSTPQVVAAAAAVLGRQATAVRSSRADGPLPRLRSYPSEEAEAAGIAAGLMGAHADGLSWGAMAVLARTNGQLNVIAHALTRAGVAFRALPSAEDDRAAAAKSAGDATGPAAAPHLHVVDGGGPGEVALCTFHRAKGLQWHSVWLCGLEAGLVPIAYAGDGPALAEERRLLYVAITRAEQVLHCSWARSRRAGNGAALWREPSPWLATLARHCQADESAAQLDLSEGRPALDFLASARRRLARTRGGAPLGPAPTDQAGADVADGLREWRRRMARASGVPPFALLHDATLAAIAARRPETMDDLLAVPGMGPVKGNRYGGAILEVVQRSAGVPVPAGA
jgi:ATP-dependent DNA helicase UvrD/PcrA